jgi:hypothetical protein
MKKLSFLGLLSILLIIGCKPQSNYTIGDPSSKLAGIAADWQISEVFIVDEVAINKDEADVSKYFTVDNDPFSINFNSESFTYATTGIKGIKYFGNTGEWAFDDNDFPTEILVTPRDGTSPFTLSLLGPIREVDQELQVQYFKGCSGSDPTMSLKLTFNRINN